MDAVTLYGTLHGIKLPPHASPSHCVSIWMHQYLETNRLPLPTYDGTNQDNVNIWRSLCKLLRKPVLSYDEHLLERAMEITYRQLKVVLEQPPCLNPEFTMSSKPALWWKYYGYETKEEVLRSKIFWEAYSECAQGVRNFPPYAISGKREFLTKEEIAVDRKIRTFVLESLELVAEHHYLWGMQNQKMKELQPGFIRYGINLHDGGFHRMVRRSFRSFFSMLDVSGWDRSFSLAEACQRLRKKGMCAWFESKGMSMPKELSDRIDRANQAYTKPTLLLPTGDVVRITWSQPSGSVLTTSNNCLGHNIMENYKLLRACPSATDDEIVSQGTNLYGDDIFAGYTDQFGALKSEAFVNSVYGEFGMQVKKGSFRVSMSPEGLSFLGGTCRTFKRGENIYFVPSYNRERVMAGLQWSIDKLGPDDELMKVYSLLELGWFDCYDEITSYLKFLLEVLPRSNVVESFLSRGVPSREGIMLAWAGMSAAAV